MAGEPLTSEQVDALLQKLSTDDAFRKQFASGDLAGAFSQLPGKPPVPPDLEPGCCLLPKSLASKEQIAASRQAIAEKLKGQNTHTPHVLEG